MHLQHALSWGGIDAVTHLCLGQAFYMAGRFGESADALATANGFVPLEGVTLRLYARARTFSSARTPICRSTSRSAGRCASGNGRRGARGGPIGMPIISNAALVPET